MIHLMKFGATQVVRLTSIFGDKSILPTFTRVYPNHPALTHRVYIPKSYQSGQALPLYFHIHGGGFALMSPLADDKFCTTFANDNKILVISLDYPKSPEVQCPTPVHQVIDVVKAILADESLPFDKKKIAVGGFSAGANLSLAISQDEDLRLRIGGVVAFYPPVNWTTSLEYKLSTRPKDAPPDLLRNMCIPFDWAYLNPDQDLRDPQLSVAFAPRENLPRNICIFGCELDLLCREAEVMAENLANTGPGQRVGTDLAWEKNGIKWEKVMGVEHGEYFSSP
jgi:acetyl esterase/lipase